MELQQAYQQLQRFNKSFLGNIEGKDVFEGKVDVLVTEGFAGNIFLKTAEGLAAFVLEQIKRDETLSQNKNLTRELDTSEYPGALLAGIDGLVIKCHGHAGTRTLGNALSGAIELAKENFQPRFASYF